MVQNVTATSTKGSQMLKIKRLLVFSMSSFHFYVFFCFCLVIFFTPDPSLIFQIDQE